MVLLLSSGGLDSTTLAYWLTERNIAYQPLFSDYGQHCVETEWETLQHALPPGARPPKRVNLSSIFQGSRSLLIAEANPWLETVEDRDLYLPYRTLFFFSAAAAFAQTNGITDVFSAFINSNHAKELDCTATFFNTLDALAENVGPVRFKMPFRDWAKAQVVAEAVRLGVNIAITYSCQLYSDIPCGACPNCVERLKAIEANRG